MGGIQQQQKWLVTFLNIFLGGRARRGGGQGGEVWWTEPQTNITPYRLNLRIKKPVELQTKEKSCVL